MLERSSRVAMADPVTIELREKVVDHDLNHGQEKLQRNKENDTQEKNNVLVKLCRLVPSDRIDIFLKVFFILLSIPWFTSIIFFSIFDTKCIVFEQASVINCSQRHFISKPRHWVFAWHLMSIISCLVLILIIRLNHKNLNYQSAKAKKIFKKGYVGSLVFLLLSSLIYFGFRIYSTKSEKTGLSMSVLVFIWRPVIVVVICCLNYIPRVHWRNSNLQRNTPEWLKKCFTRNSNFIIYWLALVILFVEITCRVGSMMLDVAEDVAPLIQNKFPDESGRLRGVMVIVIGFNLAFHVRLLSFFWQKLFHGEKDLFTEPNLELVEESLVETKQQDDLETDITLEEVNVNTNADRVV